MRYGVPGPTTHQQDADTRARDDEFQGAPNAWSGHRDVESRCINQVSGRSRKSSDCKERQDVVAPPLEAALIVRRGPIEPVLENPGTPHLGDVVRSAICLHNGSVESEVGWAYTVCEHVRLKADSVEFRGDWRPVDHSDSAATVRRDSGKRKRLRTKPVARAGRGFDVR